MGGDVSAAARDGVAPRAMQEGSRQLRQAMPRAARQVQGSEVERSQREKSGQVRARPLPIHVRLSGTDLAVKDDPPGGGLVVDAYLGRAIGGTVAVDAAPAVRFHHGQAADPDARGHGKRRSPGSGFKSRQAGQAPAFRLGRVARGFLRPIGCCGSGSHRAVPCPGGKAPATLVPWPLAAPWRWKDAPLSHSRRACQ